MDGWRSDTLQGGTKQGGEEGKEGQEEKGGTHAELR